MTPVDVERALLDVFDGLGIRATTVLRTGTDDIADDDLANLPVVQVVAMSGSESYGVFRTDPVLIRCLGRSRAEARDLASRVMDEVAGVPHWTPNGLLDSFDILDGPSREPGADDDTHEYVMTLGVETRPA